MSDALLGCGAGCRLRLVIRAAVHADQQVHNERNATYKITHYIQCWPAFNGVVNVLCELELIFLFQLDTPAVLFAL